MRITYRARDFKVYWAARWGEIPVDCAIVNRNIYPLKYAEMTIRKSKRKFLRRVVGLVVFYVISMNGVTALSVSTLSILP